MSMKQLQKIRIVDTTLRDGEQSPGIVFSTLDKVGIATALAQAGVEWIEAGVPIMGIEEQEAIKAMTSTPLQGKIIAWNRAYKEDIMASITCGCSMLHISVPVSDLHIQQKIRKSRGWVLTQLEEAIKLAQSFGCQISVGAEDASRADMEFFLQVAEVAARRGALHIRYADTVGCLLPTRVDEIFQKLVPLCPLPIEVHMHNDFGLATANTLVALGAGAELASVTVGGIGERAGNASLEEVVMGAQGIYHMDTGIELQALGELSSLVMKISEKTVFPYKPVVGSLWRKKE